MKRVIIVGVIVFLFIGVVFADSDLLFYPDDWFSEWAAKQANIPADMSEREIEIYRAGFAHGHHAALNPDYIPGLYVLNTKTKKFHLSNCMTTLMIEVDHREHSYELPEDIMADGYKPCGQCNPEREIEQEDE